MLGVGCGLAAQLPCMSIYSWLAMVHVFALQFEKGCNNVSKIVMYFWQVIFVKINLFKKRMY